MKGDTQVLSRNSHSTHRAYSTMENRGSRPDVHDGRASACAGNWKAGTRF
jgi:hypothetical protein